MTEDVRALAKELISFLRGEGSLDGVWFGDRHPTEKGAYWWRRRLPALAAALECQPPVTAEEVRRLIKFADESVRKWAEGDADGDLFDELKAHGLIAQVEGGFDPDRHRGPYDDFLKRGDEYYEIAPWLAAALNRAKQQEKA